MNEQKIKRVRRTIEQRVADIDEKIAAANSEIEKLETKLADFKKETADKIKAQKAKIKKLEQQKTVVSNPKPRARRVGMNSVLKKAKEMGLSPAEVAEKLGIEL